MSPPLRSLSRRVLACATFSAAAFLAACASAPVAPRSGDLRFEGRVAAVDMTPWTYDGNAVITVDSDTMGRLAVELPARWNLCRARPVEAPDALAGQRVRVVARASGAGRAVVCEDAGHRVERLP